jgi:hypothetical protein
VNEEESQLFFKNIVEQRNTALNAVAELNAKYQVAMSKIQSLEDELSKHKEPEETTTLDPRQPPE